MADLPGKAIDLAVCTALASATIAYLWLFPRNLGPADESFFLYEAARVRNGEVMYRDIFQFITPLSAYAMALLYWLFGTSIETARTAAAVVHGATVALIYLACRQLRVRRTIAALAAGGYLAIAQPTWPFASWHWFSTLCTTLLLFVALVSPWARRPIWAFAPGVAAGLLAGVQQQKGAALVLSVALLFLADHVVDRLYGADTRWPALVRRLGAFVAGVATVVLPLLAYSVATAGFAAVYDALVRWPLQTYRTNFHIGWGELAPLAKGFASNTFPPLLRYAPVAALPLLLRGVSDLIARAERERLRRDATVLAIAAASVASILYYPDIIHIAFIACVFLICAAAAVDWLLRLWGHETAGANVAVASATAALGAVLVMLLIGNLRRAEAQFANSADTAFGRVAFSSRWEPLLVGEVRRHLRDAGSTRLFAYPGPCAMYLLAGADNPTPYQFFHAGKSPAEQTERVLSILRRSDLPYVVGWPIFMRDGDPVVDYIKEHYEKLDLPTVDATGETPLIWLFGRKKRGAERP